MNATGSEQAPGWRLRSSRKQFKKVFPRGPRVSNQALKTQFEAAA